ncbi:MAG TPA: hypothetical protein PK466_01325 [Thermotogota bacterium]|nr:hypothetical protein [Thermotogota bacterium]HPJ87619.1 hypothetical protein [Thermotogota bacterium]HPR94943.1 hypothetical protein [Thermotogota bacterium]
MPEFVVNSIKFRKIIEYCNKLTGTDKNNKFVYLYHKDGLKIFASDGCIRSMFNLKQNIEFFKGAYTLSIITLKQFIDIKSDEGIIFIMNSDGIILKQANEVLSVRQNPVRNPPENNTFDLLCELETNEFLSGLDFATVHIPEDENCYFFVFEDILYILTVYDNIFSLYYSGTKCRSFESTVPYQSLRHLIKAQNTLKTEKIKLGISLDNDRLGFQTAGLLTSLCSRRPDHEEIEDIVKLIRIYKLFRPLYRIDRNVLYHNVTKTERILPGMPMNMIIKGNEIRFESKSDSFYYACKGRIEERYEEKNISFSVLGKYLKSALSRIGTKYVYMYYYSNYLAIGDKEKKKLIVFATDYTN